jgi:hypothetical protein
MPGVQENGGSTGNFKAVKVFYVKQIYIFIETPRIYNTE